MNQNPPGVHTYVIRKKMSPEIELQKNYFNLMNKIFRIYFVLILFIKLR